MKESVFKKMFILISFTMTFSVSHSQLSVESVSNHSIKYSFENNSNSVLRYFETNCFYITKRRKKKADIIVLRRHRSNLRNDTLFLYLHDIDFHDFTNTKNADYNDCKENGLWEYKKLRVGAKSKRNIIRINKKIKYKVLCIHYNVVADKKRYKKLCFNRKTKKWVEIVEVNPTTNKGETDLKFDNNGIDQGLGYRWYPKHSFW